ncbi:MAG: serine hydrolase domain-containing protein [Candidatus Zixiibacteriota bacterium]
MTGKFQSLYDKNETEKESKVKKLKTGLTTFGYILIVFVSCTSTKNETKNYHALVRQIDKMRYDFEYPAVAFGVIRNDSVLLLNAVGYRDIATKEKVNVTDYFHIGSCTKSFTALLSGKLIEDGYLDWNTEFFTLFPELKENSHPAYHHITLEQLLSHRARLISFKEDAEVFPIIATYEKNLLNNTPLAQKRYHCIAQILRQDPQSSGLPLSKLYSNAGYMAAALMLEKVTGKTWEELIMDMSDELNLGIHIGWPVDLYPDQPKGHINPKKWDLDIDKELVPISDQLRKYHFVNQFNLLTAPGGNISITLKGFLEYAQLLLSGLKGDNNFLKAETYQKIFNSYPEYSLGWWVEGNSESKRYAHRGSNGTFYSFICVRPNSDLGIVVMINTYKETGLTDIIQLLEKEFII